MDSNLKKPSAEVLPISDRAAVQAARRIIAAGGVIAFPTDTVYGIGCSAVRPHAIRSLYLIKQRDTSKGIPILIADLQDLEQIAGKISPAAVRLAEAFWPGPLTMVLPAHPDLPAEISPTPTVGVRIPDDPHTRQLLQETGPLAATSANLSGEESATSADQVRRKIGTRLDLILDGGPSPVGVASTVINLTSGQPELLREGPISLQQIQALLRD
jgi:L-threonylcarbamoyladenylate synthase